MILRMLSFSLAFTLVQGIAHADWTSYHHDAAHTGRASTTFDVNDLELAWTVPASSTHQPAIYKDSLIISAAHNLTSYQIRDGQLNWNIHLGYNTSPITIADGYVFYVAEENSNADPALFVHDLATGEFKYSQVLAGHPFRGLTPTVYRDPDTETLVAYVTSSDVVTALQIDDTYATELWRYRQKYGWIGGQSHLTVVEDSLIINGPGQHFAINRYTGEENHFRSENYTGGGGTTATYDAERRQFYIADHGVTAYKYHDHSNIEMLWHASGSEGVAIGEDGKVYVSAGGIEELDPDTGELLRAFYVTTDAPFYNRLANQVTPVVTTGYVWGFSHIRTIAFDLETGELARGFSGSIGNYNTAYSSTVVASNNYLITRSQSGLRVWVAPIPEPSTLALTCLMLSILFSNVRPSR